MTDVLDLLMEPVPEPVRGRYRRRHSSSVPAVPRRYRPDIEGLRAIAIVSIVLYQADFGIRNGFVGIDVFFVISGFVVTRQLLAEFSTAGIAALPAFYSRRIRRVVPSAAALVVIVVIATRFWAGPLSAHSLATDAAFSSGHWLNYRPLQQGMSQTAGSTSLAPLQHLWPLAVAGQFYLALPVLIVACGVMGERRRLKDFALATALAAVIALSFHSSIVLAGQSPSWAYFSLQTRAWEPAVGALLAVGAGTLARMPKWLAEAGALIGLAVVLASSFIVGDLGHPLGSVAALPVAGTALVIAGGIGARRRVERILGESLMQCVGRVSFSWYLWSLPVLVIPAMIAGHPPELAGTCRACLGVDRDRPVQLSVRRTTWPRTRPRFRVLARRRRAALRRRGLHRFYRNARFALTGK